jgi:protein TonB
MPTLDAILENRLQQLGNAYRRPGLLASIGLHGIFVAAVFLAPLAARRSVEPLEFVAVQIVPLQALGERSPTPPQPEAAPQQLPSEQPAPVLPSPEVKSRPRPEPRRAEEDSSRSASVPTEAPAVTRQRRQGSPLGSSLGTSALGATVGGLDNPDFVYSYYVDQMLAMISANWLRPAIGGEIEATLHFRIHRDGGISELRVVTSSGFNTFDLAGLRAVQQAAPFPNLPQSYPHRSLGVTLIVR